MSDERFGVPSASGMHRIANCPASFQLSKSFQDPGSDDSRSGDRVHLALERWGEHGSEDGLTLDELTTAEMCIDQRNELLDSWVGDDDYEAYKERRLGMTTLGKVFETTSYPALKYIVTGQADFIAVADKRGLVVDYKTLHGDHDPAEENDQLRTLAVLAARHYKLDHVRIALVQPWKGKPTLAEFNFSALVVAEEWLMDALALERRSTPDQTNPGKWCHFCPARANCKAFSRETLTPIQNMAINLPADDETARKAMFARAAELPHNELVARYKALKMISWYVTAVEGNMRIRAAEVPGFPYRLVEGKPKETIADVSAAWRELEKLGVSAEDFTAECKTSKKAVAALVRKATGAKGKELNAKVKECLRDAVSLVKPPVKLVPVNGVIEDEQEQEDGELGGDL